MKYLQSPITIIWHAKATIQNAVHRIFQWIQPKITDRLVPEAQTQISMYILELFTSIVLNHHVFSPRHTETEVIIITLFNKYYKIYFQDHENYK